MSGFSAPRNPRSPFPRGLGRNSRARAIVPTIIVLVVLVVLFEIFTNFWTDRLWFDSIGFGRVFTTTLVTKIGLFVILGALFGAVVFVNLAIAHRLRPRVLPASEEQHVLDRYREVIGPRKKLIAAVFAGVLGLIAGSSAAGHWDTFLAWMHGQPFGTKDQQFGKDVSFYLFGYPWYRFLLDYGFAAVVLCLVAALIAHYLYGGIRLRSAGEKATTAAQAHLSVLLGLFVALKAVAYWFDRYGLVLGSHHVSGFDFTGITYADAHALLPAKTILAFIAGICALLFFANIVRRTWLLPGLGLGLLVLSAVLLGWLWPVVVQQVQVKPNEPDREKPFIAYNIAATRQAYGVANAKVQDYTANTSATPGQLAQDAETLPGIRLIDPTVVPPTFEQLQQIRGFYSFSDPLDVDRYVLGTGKDQKTEDAVVAVREINLEGIPAEQRNWNNDHTVYTHGYGFVAAYGNKRSADGSPEWMEKDIPSTGQLGKFEPRIYFGENSPQYSIVGAPSGNAPIETDVPTGTGKGQAAYTYEGKGGIPIGSFVNRVLYASKFQDFNIMLSGRINADSKILYDRNPRDRVQQAAPWLKVDSDAYPAIIDGRIKWIVDGYTTSDSYPMSNRLDLADATSDSLTSAPAIGSQSGGDVNYMRNSVKAVVDAYDGTVDLYAWDQKDPVLRTWESVFPGLVKPRSAAPAQLIDHVRYPEDLMKVQREILAQYHVTNPKTFYEGSERWRVPEDPNPDSQGRKQPAYYLSVKMPGQDAPTFSLTSTYIYYNRENLAAFVAVDADARSPDYGTIRVLQLVGDHQIDGPKQIANKLGSDDKVTQALFPFKQAGATVERGNLLTLPVGGGLLYVEPIYVESSGSSGYPLLRLVFASFGGKIGVGSTLQAALNQVFGGNAGAQTGEGGGTTTQNPPPSKGKPQTSVPPDVVAALDEASADFAKAQQALKAGKLDEYAQWVGKAQAAVERAKKAQESATGESGSGSSSGSGAGSGAGSAKGSGKGAGSG